MTMRKLFLAVVLLASGNTSLYCSTGCAAALPIIAAAIPIADRALDWISQVERHAEPLLDAVDAPTAQAVRDGIPIARSAALAVRNCGLAAQGGSKVDCAEQLATLERELDKLFGAARPLGVMPVGEPGLLGAPPGGAGILGVPRACEIVRGAEACGASPAPAQGAP